MYINSLWPLTFVRAVWGHRIGFKPRFIYSSIAHFFFTILFIFTPVAQNELTSGRVGSTLRMRPTAKFMWSIIRINCVPILNSYVIKSPTQIKFKKKKNDNKLYTYDANKIKIRQVNRIKYNCVLQSVRLDLSIIYVYFMLINRLVVAIVFCSL